jgi:mono/diheme cytochrome c family protein
MRSPLPHSFLAVLLLLGSPLAAQDDPGPDARALFLANCATCHGETGDGKGVTQLDRPARSFKDGGFSFGNTPEALFRTLTMGIPGTPMPAFGESLTEPQRHALARYVITLGPPVTEVERSATRIVVGERPEVVRGLLPALVDGGERWPRGLLLGTPDGMSFEYRVDDVRLLGVRQGEFVERQDWNGRGGTALLPLGQLVHLVEGGRPEPMFRGDSGPLDAGLVATEIAGQEVRLSYTLRSGDQPVAAVREIPRAIATPLASGFTRRLEIRPAPGAGPVELRAFSARPEEVFAGGGNGTATWVAIRRSEGPVEWVAVTSNSRELQNGPTAGFLRLAPGSAHEVELTTLLVSDWNADTPEALLEAIAR